MCSEMTLLKSLVQNKKQYPEGFNDTNNKSFQASSVPGVKHTIYTIVPLSITLKLLNIRAFWLRQQGDVHIYLCWDGMGMHGE